jgi:hypothetical protein
MRESTSHHDVIERPGSPEMGVLFPVLSKKFLVRQPFPELPLKNRNDVAPLSLQGHQRTSHEDLLVRLPSLAESKWKVKVLQAWVGLVEHVGTDRFLATLSDVSNPRNPPEEVELDLSEVSESDGPLLTGGAKFYWSIGYSDTPGGQRERVSSLRFARQPRLSKDQVNRIFEQADRLAAFLESD